MTEITGYLLLPSVAERTANEVDDLIMWQHACDRDWSSFRTVMDFTELYRQSASLVTFSPGAHFLLTAVQDRVIVRRTDTFQITRTWLVDGTQNPTQAALFSRSSQKQRAQAPPGSASGAVDSWITHLGWSCDSEYILAACAKQGVVHLLKLRDEEWNGRIDAGAEGDQPRLFFENGTQPQAAQASSRQNGHRMDAQSFAFRTGV